MRALFQDLEARGLVKQVTDPALLQSDAPRTLYCGFDPTADSLHVGSLLPLLTLRRFQQAGHTIIPVAGGATGMIGDPTGKTQERSLLTEDSLAHNVRGITRVMQKFLPGTAVVNNAEWFRGFSYLEFLRDVGKHFTVNYMVAKESVRARLEDREQGISYTEFSYMLLQAYDFYHLNRQHGCTLQIGGSDQWGNITAGVELIRRMHHARAAEGEAPQVFGMTHPLVMKADGTKFGKTEAGTVWLSPERTSPYDFYQFFIQTSDADAVTYLKYFTFLSLPEIAELEAALKRAPEKREAQTALAREVTRLVHGEAELAQAEKAVQALFGKGGGDGESSFKDFSEAQLLSSLKSAPQKVLPRAPLDSSAGFPLVDALVATELCASKGAARKDIAGGGIYVNNDRALDAAAALKAADLIAGKYVVLRKGKKNYFLAVFTG